MSRFFLIISIKFLKIKKAAAYFLVKYTDVKKTPHTLTKPLLWGIVKNYEKEKSTKV